MLSAFNTGESESLRTVNRLQAQAARSLSGVAWLGPRVALRMHRRGWGTPFVRWPELAQLVEEQRPVGLSVDVFDTCITRDLLGDEPIELAIRRRLRQRLISAANQRLDRHDPSDTDGLVVDIRDPKNPAAYVSESAESVAADMEKLLYRAVPGAVDALSRVRAAGVPIVFVSDTDRRSHTLREMLSEVGLFDSRDRLIASCEAGATKSNGDLFHQIWPANTPRSRQLWHVGNNLWSDVVQADAAGITGFALVAAEPSRYEEAMASSDQTFAGPAVAAAARQARLTLETQTAPFDSSAYFHLSQPGAPNPVITGDPERARKLMLIGAQVPGQAFGAFVLWLAEQSRRTGVEHLAFLSRDARLLLNMADVIPPDHWEGISRSYLPCSRRAWFLTGAVSYGFDAWLRANTLDHNGYLRADRRDVNLHALLARMGLTPHDLADHPGLRTLDPSQSVPTDALPHWDDFIHDTKVQSIILARSEERRNTILDYLRGLGIPSRPIGMVDVGWSGRLAWIMSPLVAEVTGHEPVHFHLGGDKVQPDIDTAVDIKRFAFDGSRTNPTPIYNPVSCVETFTGSNEPRVAGYEYAADGTVELVLEGDIRQAGSDIRKVIWAGAVETARNLPTRRTLEATGIRTDFLGNGTQKVLARWWLEPDANEVNAIRGMAFEADDNGEVIKPLVSPYSLAEVTLGASEPRLWSEGSRAITPRPLSDITKLYRRIKGRR